MKANYLVTGKSRYLEHIIDVCVPELKRSKCSLAQDIRKEFPIIAPEELFSGTGNYCEEVKTELCKRGVLYEHIINFGNYVSMSSARQYFEELFLEYGTWDEVTTLNFSAMGNACSDICANGETVLYAV